MNEQEYKMLRRACKRLKDGPDYRMDHYAFNLINTVLDFQSRVEVAGRAQEYYMENIGYESHRHLKREMERFPNTEKGNRKLAQYLWKTDMWTRAEFLRVLMKELEERGIRGQKSLKRWLHKADFERDGRRISDLL